MAVLTVQDNTRNQAGAIYFEHHRVAKSALTVVLAHGWGMSSRIWDDTTAWLIDSGYSVLAFDQRNCGASDKDFADVSIEALSQDLAALVDHCSITSAVLNGWSLGGAVVTGAAPLLGDKLAGLVSTCGATPRYTQAEGFPHGGTADDVAGTVTALRADRVNFLEALYCDGAFVKPVSDAIKTWAHGIALQASPAADASLGALASIDQRDTMGALQVPALFITSSADGVVDPAIGEFAANLAPHGQLAVMDGCGHTPFIEDPTAYRDAVGRFLASIATS